MDTSGIITIESAVTDFLLAYKHSTEDYITFLRHACTLLTQYMMHSSPEARSEKVTINSLGIVEFPSDCIKVKDICVAKNGEWWSMTMRPDMVNTTTFTGITEGQDTDFGEGVALRDGITGTYGSRGAVNAYYYMIDYKQRRVFVDGLTSDTALLRYISSGIEASETTYVPIMLIPMLESYLLWKESYFVPTAMKERQLRERDYINEELKLRNFINGLSASQWKDVFWGSFSQSPKR